MRKNIGSALALYPMPVTVVGAMNGDEPTWTLVAHVGIIGHDRVTVSLASRTSSTTASRRPGASR